VLFLQSVHDVAEDVTDGRAKQGQDHDNDDSDQHEDESVLYEALTLFARQIKHDTSPMNGIRKSTLTVSWFLKEYFRIVVLSGCGITTFDALAVVFWGLVRVLHRLD